MTKYIFVPAIPLFTPASISASLCAVLMTQSSDSVQGGLISATAASRLSHQATVQERTPPDGGAPAAGAPAAGAAERQHTTAAKEYLSLLLLCSCRRNRILAVPRCLQSYSTATACRRRIPTSATVEMDRWRPPWTRKKRDARPADPPKLRRDNDTGASLPPSIPTLPHRAKPEASSITHTVSSQTHNRPVPTSLQDVSPPPAQPTTSHNNRHAKRQERPSTADGHVAKRDYWQLAIQQVHTGGSNHNRADRGTAACGGSHRSDRPGKTTASMPPSRVAGPSRPRDGRSSSDRRRLTFANSSIGS